MTESEGRKRKRYLYKQPPELHKTCNDRIRLSVKQWLHEKESKTTFIDMRISIFDEHVFERERAGIKQT